MAGFAFLSIDMDKRVKFETATDYFVGKWNRQARQFGKSLQINTYDDRTIFSGHNDDVRRRGDMFFLCVKCGKQLLGF